MENIDDDLERSTQSFIDILIKPTRNLIHSYKCDPWKKDKYSFLRKLNKLYDDFKYIQDGRLNYYCKQYENLKLLPEEEVRLQVELNDLLVEIYELKKNIEKQS
jgi:hypothetical protein